MKRATFLRAMFTVLCLSGTLAHADDTPWRVLGFQYGDAGGDFGSAVMTSSLNQAGCKAEEARALPSWNTPTTPDNNTRLLRIARVGFGERADLFVFQLDNKGTLIASLHVPYGMSIIHRKPAWRVPTELLAEHIAIADPDVFHLQGAQTATLTITPWSNDIEIHSDQNDDLDDLDLLDDEDDMGDDPKNILMGPPLTPTSQKEDNTVAFDVLAWGMAANAGWQPSTQSADTQLSLAVRKGKEKADFNLTCTQHGDTTTYSAMDVPQNLYADTLRALFLAMRLGDRVTTVLRFDTSESIIGTAPGVVIVSNGKTARALDASTGALLWTLPPKETLVHIPGGMVVLSKTMHLMNPADGSLTALAPLGKTSPRMCLLANKTLAVAEGNICRLYRDGAQVWEYDSGKPIRTTPIDAGAFVCIMSDGGQLAALKTDDGTLAWETTLTPPAEGTTPARVICEGKLLAIEWTPGDIITTGTLSEKGFTPAWTCPVNDRIIAMPQSCGAGLLVAAKNNHILNISPADGSIHAKSVWSTWLMSVHATSSGVVVMDYDGTLSLLDANKLAPICKVSFGTRTPGGLRIIPTQEDESSTGVRLVQPICAGTAFVMQLKK